MPKKLLANLTIVSYRIGSMKAKQTLLGLAALLAVFTGSLVYAQPAAAKSLQCSVLPKSICDASKQGDLEKSGTWLLLLFILNILTIGVGIVAVGAIGYAGFLYATASDNESQVKQAKDMIRNTVVGIGAYGFMYVLLQFLIPGGVFK